MLRRSGGGVVLVREGIAVLIVLLGVWYLQHSTFVHEREGLSFRIASSETELERARAAAADLRAFEADYERYEARSALLLDILPYWLGPKEFVDSLNEFSHLFGVGVASHRFETRKHERYTEVVLTMKLEGSPKAMERWWKAYRERELAIPPRPIDRLQNWHQDEDLEPQETRVSLYAAPKPSEWRGGPCERFEPIHVWLPPYSWELKRMRAEAESKCAELSKLGDVATKAQQRALWQYQLEEREKLVEEIRATFTTQSSKPTN